MFDNCLTKQKGAMKINS